MHFNNNRKNGKSNSVEVNPRRRNRIQRSYNYALDGAPGHCSLSPVDRVREKLKEQGCKIQESGDGWSAQCPAHHDLNPSLSITTAEDGRVLLHCHAGCDFEEILDALELEKRDLFPDVQSNVGNRKIEKPKQTPRQPQKQTNPKTNQERRNRRRKTTNIQVDWGTRSKTFAENLPDEKLAKLAAELRVRREDLRALKMGWDHSGQGGAGCFTFPEFNAESNVIGIATRSEDGRKAFELGGHRGLYMPVGWQDHNGPIFLVEGATDTAVMNAMELAVIGRPSASGGVLYLGDILQNVPDDREIIVMGEFDQKADGRWPGRKGAFEVAEKLSYVLRREVLVSFPPAGAKDVRDWFSNQSNDGETI